MHAVNVLIAIVSDINTDVTDKAEVEVRKLRAQRIIDEDALMSQSERRDRGCFPEYLEVLQARAPDEPPSEIINVEAKMKENHEAMVAKHEQMETKLGEVEADMNAKLDTLTAMMERLLAQEFYTTRYSGAAETSALQQRTDRR